MRRGGSPGSSRLARGSWCRAGWAGSRRRSWPAMRSLPGGRRRSMRARAASGRRSRPRWWPASASARRRSMPWGCTGAGHFSWATRWAIRSTITSPSRSTRERATCSALRSSRALPSSIRSPRCPAKRQPRGGLPPGSAGAWGRWRARPGRMRRSSTGGFATMPGRPAVSSPPLRFASTGPSAATAGGLRSGSSRSRASRRRFARPSAC